jgi:hypothetical protein
MTSPHSQDQDLEIDDTEDGQEGSPTAPRGRDEDESGEPGPQPRVSVN